MRFGKILLMGLMAACLMGASSQAWDEAPIRQAAISPMSSIFPNLIVNLPDFFPNAHCTRKALIHSQSMPL